MIKAALNAIWEGQVQVVSIVDVVQKQRKLSV